MELLAGLAHFPYLTAPIDDGMQRFLRIVDADLHWRHYLFGRQRPETQVETMSWYIRAFC